MPPNTGLVRHHPCQQRPDFLMDLMFDCYQKAQKGRKERERGTSVPLSTTMAIEQGGPVGPAGNPSHQSTPINPDRLLPPHLLAPTPWARGKRCYRRSNAINQADDGLSLATRAPAPQRPRLRLFPLPEVLKFPASGKRKTGERESNTTHALPCHSLSLVLMDIYFILPPSFFGALNNAEAIR
ncbi:uncharacterized protein CDAR_40351 [Caerostris darwini]|uniref:Uncharacterized protein n=1 Tax=Caerostris darwini TaxID=1538125 RepID=A0AAV4RBY9_9ARAC|nr:uncharacterized protein CDAR_40351 [Caerostris darwini]